LKYHSFPTDESGRLRFEYPYTGARPMLNIEFRKNGYVPLHRGWGFGDGSDATEAFTVRLRRGTTMGGIVVYAADRPVEGVTVVMTVQEYGPEKRPENPTGYENYYEVPTRTGTDGRWRTDSVPPGALKVNLQLIHADFVSDSTTFFGVPGRSPKVADLRDLADRQVLIKGVKISGRVLDTQGNPIRGADVVDSTRGFTFVDYLRNAQTDADGRFHFHLARGGDMTLTLQVKGYQPSTVQARAEAGASPIEIRLAPSRGLRGRVVDAQGKPIAGVGIMSKAIGMHKEISLRLFTDAQGRFVWDGAPDEKVGMTIFAEGFFPIESMPLGATEQEMVIVLKPALDVRLRVVDAGTGKPVPRFGIQIGKANKGNQEFRWEVPTIGTFEGEYHTSLAGEDGPYQFKVIADGYEPAQTRVFRGEEKSVREVIRLKNEHE
jgi:5-hydroxyisourate hydrolase-like protein (transthyretin family)